MTIKFITRNEKGVLQQNLAYWDMFKEELFSLAKNENELEFIGQLVEDLQHEYEEKLEEMED
ncbi:hypothetical protein [Lysinibacillus parviboronicapiens]|uniref:hypothetical protein n=1 Tax=Lysinibacillus parviboronicapiens TaxID=436516 RepID=UPI000D35B1F0|nr:hypothetical protein [Lysinibacillus parviboronicapiens]